MKEQKEKVLKKLMNTYCRLRPSDIGGVGVFAIRNIPKDIDPFNKDEVEWLEFNIDELKDLDEEVRKMIDDFFVIEENGGVLIPEYGLNGIDISFFVNNSSSPNLHTPDDGTSFKTLRPINNGEELTVDYSVYDYKYRKNNSDLNGK